MSLISSAIWSPFKLLKTWKATRQLLKGVKRKPKITLLALRALWLARAIQRQNMEAIHAHWPYGSMLGYLAAELTGLSFSISVHAHEVAHQNGHFPVILPQVRFAAFCNRAAMEYLARSVGPEIQDKMHLVYHGVDLERFPELPIPDTRERLHILTAGRFTPTKGFDRLVEACAEARSSGLEVKLTILGDGPEKKRIKEMAELLGFAAHLSLPGWVPHSELVDYLAKAHCVALLADTNYHDGLPNIVLEGMACGRPAIVSPLPAAPEAVTSGKNGYILKSERDYVGFGIAVTQLLRPEVLKQMGADARRTIEKKYDERIMIARLRELFIETPGTTNAQLR